ncbi:MAG: hypothetical protein EOP63_13625 [Sphingomonadales bacterium]|nr:MAG: hypothetical protein EOP63_13625 [Sphingomonadales bacterium]
MREELEAVGHFAPFFMHSFGEGAQPMLIHGQVVCDLATVVEIAERMIVALDALDPKGAAAR